MIKMEKTTGKKQINLKAILIDAAMSEKTMQDNLLKDTPIGRRSENLFLNVVWLLENTDVFETIKNRELR